MSVALDTLLTRSPDVCGGRLRIGGTRITVHQIVTLYQSGFSPEEITDQYPHLELAQVYAAITWYHANRQEVESALAAELDEAERLEKQCPLGRLGSPTSLQMSRVCPRPRVRHPGWQG